ncbi:unnamed protein product [Boreogadus saida]
MESYEEFALRTMALLRAKEKSEEMDLKTQCSLKDLSAVLFYGKPVLPPLLTAEQRRVMRDHRERAVQAHADRLNQRKNCVLNRVQNILDLAVKQVDANKGPSVTPEDQLPRPGGPSPKHETVNGYTLVTDSPGLLRDSGCPVEEPVLPGPPRSEPPHGAARVDGAQGPPRDREEEEEEEEGEEEGEVEVEEEEEEEEEEEDISLDSLLKRSREYVEKEQSRRESSVVPRTPPPPPTDRLSDREGHARSTPARDSGVEFGFSLRHSPVGPPRGPVGARRPSPSPPDPPHASQRPPSSPELILVHPVHRRKPRPVSAGNLHLCFPTGQGDLIPRSPGGTGDARGMAAWDEASPPGGARVSDLWGPGAGAAAAGRRASTCAAGRVSAPSPLGPPHEGGFRRRSHTLDSQLYPPPLPPPPPPGVDRSQERAPRFMAGVTRQQPPSRRAGAAAPLNKSYDVETPAPGLHRPHVSPDGGPPGPDARATKTVHINAPDGTTGGSPEETQWRVHALEDMQKRLEEEHVLHMSLLLAEQEREQERLQQVSLCYYTKEQERLQQELEEKERRLMGPGGDRPLSGSGLPSPSLSNRSSPSGLPPAYLWGPPWGAGKPRSRLSQVLTAEQQKCVCRLGAVARGFLTRRLMDTEKVKHLRQTVGDTKEFIRSFQSEGPAKRGSVSPQDISLQDRVRAQLRAALYDLHDIFFEMPLQDRLALLQQDRELRAERKQREMEKAKSPKDRVTALSAATQRSLDRKRRVVGSPSQGRKTSQKAKGASNNNSVPETKQGQKAPAVDELKHPGGAQNLTEGRQRRKKLAGNAVSIPVVKKKHCTVDLWGQVRSCYRKTPEGRTTRSDGLKKQNSVG